MIKDIIAKMSFPEFAAFVEYIYFKGQTDDGMSEPKLSSYDPDERPGLFLMLAWEAIGYSGFDLFNGHVTWEALNPVTTMPQQEGGDQK